MKNPLNCPTDQSPTRGLHPDPDGWLHETTPGNQEKPPQPPEASSRQSGVPTAQRLAGLPLTYCIKYII